MMSHSRMIFSWPSIVSSRCADSICKVVSKWNNDENEFKSSGTLEDKEMLDAKMVLIWEVCDKTCLE